MEAKSSNPEFAAFDRTMGKLLSVSHEELQRRMKAYKEQAAKNPESLDADQPMLRDCRDNGAEAPR